jgi:hypothetical protein
LVARSGSNQHLASAAARDVLSGPVSQFCQSLFAGGSPTAEVELARNEFRSIVYGLTAGGMFDRYRDPDCDTQFHLSDECRSSAASTGCRTRILAHACRTGIEGIVSKISRTRAHEFGLGRVVGTIRRTL